MGSAPLDERSRWGGWLASPSPPGLARTGILLGQGTLLPISDSYMVSSGQAAQNIHA